MRFVGRRLKRETSKSGNRLNRLRRVARVPLHAKEVAETFEPPPVPCGDYMLHLRMAESSFGLEDLRDP